jgi:CheY-like chemotaxis protein
MAQSAVLLVEDDEDIRRATSDFLGAEGHPCLEAANGREALERLGELARPGLVFLDLMMPIMDGLEFLEQASRSGQLSMISVVIVSASSTLSRGHVIADALPLIKKPALPDRLLELVRMHVGPPIER